jgi:hypothetical protein
MDTSILSLLIEWARARGTYDLAVAEREWHLADLAYDKIGDAEEAMLTAVREHLEMVALVQE